MKYKEIFLSTTDTVPGLGAPMTKEGLAKLYELKQRPLKKGIIILVSSIEQARVLSDWTDQAEEIAKAKWPGATTIVISKNQAVRMPNQKGLLELIEKKGPIFMTSANISGKPSLSFEEAKKEFPNLGNYYNFGEGSGKPSTIIRSNDGKVLR